MKYELPLTEEAENAGRKCFGVDSVPLLFQHLMVQVKSVGVTNSYFCFTCYFEAFHQVVSV